MVCVTATRRYNMTSIATTPQCNNAQVFPRTGAMYWEEDTPTGVNRARKEASYTGKSPTGAHRGEDIPSLPVPSLHPWSPCCRGLQLPTPLIANNTWTQPTGRQLKSSQSHQRRPKLTNIPLYWATPASAPSLVDLDGNHLCQARERNRCKDRRHINFLNNLASVKRLLL